MWNRCEIYVNRCEIDVVRKDILTSIDIYWHLLTSNVIRTFRFHRVRLNFCLFLINLVYVLIGIFVFYSSISVASIFNKFVNLLALPILPKFCLLRYALFFPFSTLLFPYKFDLLISKTISYRRQSCLGANS